MRANAAFQLTLPFCLLASCSSFSIASLGTQQVAHEGAVTETPLQSADNPIIAMPPVAIEDTLSESDFDLAALSNRSPADSEDPRDAPWHTTFADPKLRCVNLSIFIQVPTLMSVIRGGHPGHVSLGLNNEFYDFGSRLAGQGKATISGVAGDKFLTNYLQEIAWQKRKPKGDLTVEEAFNFMQGESKGSDRYQVFAYQVGISQSQAAKIRGYWKDLYKKIEKDKAAELKSAQSNQKYEPEVVYKAFSYQCTTTVHDSMTEAGIIPVSGTIRRLLPVSFRKHLLKNLKHTCGTWNGRLTIEQFTPKQPLSPWRADWGQPIPDSVR